MGYFIKHLPLRKSSPRWKVQFVSYDLDRVYPARSLYEKSTNTWVETVNCTPAWRFTKVGSDLNNLILYDAGRKLRVKLNYDGMWLKYDHETSYAFYQKGSFEKRVRFFHQYNGQWTGTLSRKHGCAWEELLAGGTAPSYHFKAYG